LAKRCGINILSDKNENNDSFRKKDELINFNERMIKLFQHFLTEMKEGENAYKYLTERKINKEIIDIFKIGFAPKEFGRLESILKKKGFLEQFLCETGIFSLGNNGLKTMFFDRVIFPIFNYKNECVAFGGRALNNDIKPKYINSPETAIYKKSYNLYGINLSKEYIQKEKKAFIVEGYVDVISCYKSGLKNVVAPCGTAITKEQIKLLARYTSEIVLLLDGDEAGLKGVGKALGESANIENMKMSVLILPDGMDPDDYFKNYNIDDFKEFEKTALSGFDYLVYYKSRTLDKNDFKSLIETLEYLYDYIKLWDNEIIRNSFLDRLSSLLELDKLMIKKEYIEFLGKHKKSADYDKKIVENKIIVLDESTKRECDLLLFLINVGDSKEIVKKCSLQSNYFVNQKIGVIFKEAFEDGNLDIKNILSNVDDDSLKKYFNERLFADEFKLSDNILRNNAIDRVIDIIKRFYIKNSDNINEKIKLAQLYKDEDLIKELQEEKTIIINEILKLSKLQELKQ